MKDRFSIIAEKIAVNEKPQGFCTDKVKKIVLQGLLPEKDMRFIADMLLRRQDSMSKEEMIQEIGKLDLLTPEAASILVSAWFDGGKNKIQWQTKDLYTWIKQKLVTKLGSERRLSRVASVVSGKSVASEYGLLGRQVKLVAVTGAGVDVCVSYPAAEDVSVENCMYDIEMLVKLWKEMLPIYGGYRLSKRTVMGLSPALTFMVSMPFGLGMVDDIPLFEEVRSKVEV